MYSFSLQNNNQLHCCNMYNGTTPGDMGLQRLCFEKQQVISVTFKLSLRAALTLQTFLISEASCKNTAVVH